MLFFREGRAKIMPLKACLVERMKPGIVQGKLAAWTAKQLKADNENVSEAITREVERQSAPHGAAPDYKQSYL